MALRNGEKHDHRAEKTMPRNNPKFLREQIVQTCEMAEKEFEMRMSRISNVKGSEYQSDSHNVEQILDSLVSSERKRNLKPVDNQPDVTLHDFSSMKQDIDIGSLFAKTSEYDYQIAWFDSKKEMHAPQNVIVRQGILREMGDASHFRNSSTSILALTEAVPGTNIMNSAEVARYNGLAIEMRQYGVDAVGEYYKAVGAISHAHSGAQIDQQVFDLQRALARLKMEKATQGGLIEKIRHVAEERGTFIHRSTLHQLQRERRKADFASGAEEIKADFDATWDDFQFFTPEEEKTFLNKLPKVVLDSAFKVREWRNMASFSKSQAAINDAVPEGMHLRLGRGETLAKFHKTESALASDPEYKQYSNRFTKEYANRVRDPFLVSEASGFEFEEKLKISDGATPNDMVFQTMNALLQQHRPKDSKSVRFTLLFGEGRIRKVKVKVHENILPDELSANIELAIHQSEDEDITSAKGHMFSMRDRVKLGFTGYSPNRINDKDYQHIYGFKEVKKKGLFRQKETVSGDYLIQIKDNKTVTDYLSDDIDEHKPGSLFVVDSHQAAVLIDLRQKKQDGLVKAVVRYNHSRFDGIQAQKHAKNVLDSLGEAHLNKAPVNFCSAEAVYSLSEADDKTYPVLEGHASLVEEAVKYPKLTLHVEGQDESVVLSPSFTRSFILALANEVDTYHHLHAGDKTKSELYDVYGDRFDDVQPITNILIRLRRDFEAWQKEPTKTDPAFVQEYLVRYNRAKKRAEKSHSDSLVAAAIVGRYEKAIVAVGSTVNKGISAYSSPGSMFSPLPRVLKQNDPDYKRTIEFRTAHSKSYANQKINLQAPESSMGIIGYAQEGTTAVTTCRKMPCQAQVEFRQAVLTDILDSSASESMSTQTLKKFSQVLTMWDELLNGKASLESYERARKEVLNGLQDPDICGEDRLARQGISDENSFQQYLNTTLQKAAESTLDRTKIEKTKELFVSYMKASGVTVA